MTLVASDTPPSSSVISGRMVYMPAWVNRCVAWHTDPGAPCRVVVPSSHPITQVCVSLLPGSVKLVVRVTGSPTRNSCHGVGDTMPSGASDPTRPAAVGAAPVAVAAEGLAAAVLRRIIGATLTRCTVAEAVLGS